MKKTFIRKCIEEYQKFFPVDWIEQLDWMDKTKYQSNYTSNVQRINTYIEISFISFSKSIISGEYVIKEKIKQDLEDFLRLLENEYPPINKPLIKNRLYVEYQKLDDNLQVIINYYRQLIHLVNNKTSQVYHRLLVNAFNTNGKKLTITQFQHLKTFVFDVCTNDHFLSYDRNSIQKLILTKESLEKEETKQSPTIRPIYHIVKDKCSFLIKKLIYFEGLAEYSINFKNILIDKRSITAECFNEFDKHFEFFNKIQYGDNEPLVLAWQDKCYRKQARISQMVLLIKYYKDSENTTKQQVDNLVTDFDALYNKIYPKFLHKPFDRYALDTIQNYMYNCRLSFYIKHDYTFELLRSDISRIEHIQATTHIKNFYPYNKAISFLINDIRNDIINKATLETISNPKMITLQSYIKKLEDTIHWCQEQAFYPVQLLYNECLKRDTNSDIIVFTPSSFSKPLNYDDLYGELQRYKAEVEILKSELNLQKERFEIEQLKKDIDASKKSNIEILGIFSAVITFLFGCVNIFSGENNSGLPITQQIIHIACLGIILLLFVSSIYILTMKKENCLLDYLRHPRFWLFALMIIGYIGILAIILCRDIFEKSVE